MNNIDETKPINSKTLHLILDELLFGLRNKTITPADAKEINNAAGKKIALVKAELDYAAMWGGKVEIEFMNESGNLLIDEDTKPHRKVLS